MARQIPPTLLVAGPLKNNFFAAFLRPNAFFYVGSGSTGWFVRTDSPSGFWRRRTMILTRVLGERWLHIYLYVCFLSSELYLLNWSTIMHAHSISVKVRGVKNFSFTNLFSSSYFPFPEIKNFYSLMPPECLGYFVGFNKYICHVCCLRKTLTFPSSRNKVSKILSIHVIERNQIFLELYL